MYRVGDLKLCISMQLKKTVSNSIDRISILFSKFVSWRGQEVIVLRPQALSV